MSSDADFPKLNRLRVNAGKPELKSWKGSKAALVEAINKLEAAGHTDALPGANTQVLPSTDDPEIAKALENDSKDDTPSIEDSALSRNVGNEDKPKAEPTGNKPHAKLARGLETDTMARNSRLAVQMQREKEKKKAKEEKQAKKALDAKSSGITLSKEDKKQIKDEAADRKRKAPKGEVDAKKEPEKAARQKKHIEDKQKARADKPKKEKSGDEVTVAELCRELDIDPKVGRAKLRRYEGKDSYPTPIKGERWTFPKKAAAELKAILKGGK